MLLFNPPKDNDASTTAALLAAAAAFKVDMPLFRQTKPKPYAVPVKSELVEIIAPTEREQPRRVTVLNKGPDLVELFFDDTPPVIEPPNTPLDAEKPWILHPGEKYIDDRDGGYGVWGVSPGNATVIVGIQYPGSTIADDDSMEIPLNVDLVLGTGDNYGEDLPFNFLPSRPLREIIDSDQNITGYKLFRFNSFMPSQEYTFNLVVADSINFDISKSDKAIKVFLFDEIRAYGALVALLSGDWGDLSYNIPKDLVRSIKKGNFIMNLPRTGGEFKLSSNFSKRYGHFTILTEDGPQGAVISQFDVVTNTFYLAGY